MPLEIPCRKSCGCVPPPGTDSVRHGVHQLVKILHLYLYRHPRPNVASPLASVPGTDIVCYSPGVHQPGKLPVQYSAWAYVPGTDNVPHSLVWGTSTRQATVLVPSPTAVRSKSSGWVSVPDNVRHSPAQGTSTRQATCTVKAVKLNSCGCIK